MLLAGIQAESAAQPNLDTGFRRYDEIRVFKFPFFVQSYGISKEDTKSTKVLIFPNSFPNFVSFVSSW